MALRAIKLLRAVCDHLEGTSGFFQVSYEWLHQSGINSIKCDWWGGFKLVGRRDVFVFRCDGFIYRCDGFNLF